MNLSNRKALCRAAFLLLTAVAALGLNAAHAKSVKQQNIVQLMKHADSIVVGTVSSKTDGFQGGLPYTEITLDVARSVKGQHGKTYTFRQFGLIAPKRMGDGRVNLMVTPAGWPTYVEGEQVMLFLHQPASRTGFQTTAGLNQGKFSIRDGKIANDVGNDALFEGVKFNAALTRQQRDLVTQTGGAYEAEAFFGLVRQAVEQQWIENGGMTDDN